MHIHFEDKTILVISSDDDRRCIRGWDHEGVELKGAPIGWRCVGIVPAQQKHGPLFAWEQILDTDKRLAYELDPRSQVRYSVKLVDDQGTNNAIFRGPMTKVLDEDVRATIPDGPARSGTHLIVRPPTGDTANDSGGSTGTDGSS